MNWSLRKSREASLLPASRCVIGIPGLVVFEEVGAHVFIGVNASTIQVRLSGVIEAFERMASAQPRPESRAALHVQALLQYLSKADSD
jgi:hypothetical protein